MEAPMSAPEAWIIGLAALIAWAYLAYGPRIEAKLRALKLKLRKQDRPTGDDNYYQGRG